MYENMTYEFIEKRVLARVKSEFDKREGSIIFDATAPVSFELAEAYIMARVILKQTFATTADREFLALRAMEFNIYPEQATYAEVEGQFSKAIDIGSRFNYEKYNFVVTEIIDNDKHTYKLKCETPGGVGNTCIGDITPISQISGLETAKITKLITPGEDEENTETFRKRYIQALKSKAYGGNNADYMEKVLAIPGVGGCKNYRAWAGGGTVKVVIVNTEFNQPTQDMIQEVQTALDPVVNQGEGYGLAPIGHKVTVIGASTVPINITATVQLDSGYTIDNVQNSINTAIDSYLLKQRKAWTTQISNQFITLRSAFIISAILDVPHIADVAGVTINGQSTKIDLTSEQIPTLGKVTITGE
ncbi:baseplate J/gp47 family protein [Megasphaera vaginalis (ex Srinivasan et al. 2021)]|uniref:Baseplate J-like protein n=1 Tax=Megasphaera vaginalis (ex Srinivasan et al. 2021) TaxID=1111454 RepID=U7UQS3_9FIRM|nr:baseplate J/gp47 family protein [Megasphaera vaginalis (ex Srinivasan et al. 2021)]ERT61254.1 baseplate J-like protein [Megasphaera vaginalis (ex Srinivasan et al. 2021)]